MVTSLGQKIKELREGKPLSQEQLAKEARGEVTRSYLAAVETGRVKKPSASKLLAIAHGLNVDPDLLFQAAGYLRPVSPPDKSLPSPAEYFQRYYGVDVATARNMRNVVEIIYDAWQAGRKNQLRRVAEPEEPYGHNR